MATPDLDLPSAGPDPLPWDTALAAVLGYARGRRPLWFRPPGERGGRWVQVPAYGYERFDAVRSAGTGAADQDILLAEALHGRLDPAGWTAVPAALDDVGPLVEAARARAAGRALWELPDDELSVLGEPGTVGAALRGIDQAPHLPYVSAALAHQHPALVPHVQRATRLQLLPHLVEGDSGLAAVVHRELVANAEAFAALEAATAELLPAPLTRLRLHDVLLWLTASLRLPHAVAAGRSR